MPYTKDPEIKRPIEQGDWNMAFLFPDEVAAAREVIADVKSMWFSAERK